jgi:formate C-acetyltransferase
MITENQLLDIDLYPDINILRDMREFFASGFFEMPNESPIRRWSRAVRRRFENRSLHEYKGNLLYPSGSASTGEEDHILSPSYSYTYGYSEWALNDRISKCNDESERQTLESMREHMRDFESRLNAIRGPHTVGGGGYTHSVPNYGRVIREGLNKHSKRIAKGLAHAKKHQDTEKIDFYLGMQDVIKGIKVWHQNILNELRTAKFDDPDLEFNRTRLISAYEQVPFKPARSFFEAMIAYNFTYYLDDCDNPGRVDQELFPYYENDLKQGLTSHEEAVKLIRNLWENADINNGWSAGIGGTTPKGEPAYNELTIACLESAHKIRRPNLQLHIRKDMPQEVWDSALDTIATGCGLPALYNEEVYISSLREAHLGIHEEDFGWHNGGGCTETMIHGRSNVGSLDAGINLPLIFIDTLRDHLSNAKSFEDFVSEYKNDVARVVNQIAHDVSRDQEAKARLRPQPMRSFLIDDCIDSGIEFNAGGARYNWSVINVAGLANVIDSLSAIKEVVFEKKEKTGIELWDILRNNFEGEEAFRKRLERCPRFGNDDPIADEIAKDIAGFVFGEFLRYAPWRGGKFLASCLMFVTYADAGLPVSATPDGRLSGSPLADSAGPVQGRDKKGPTAMLKSVASIPHHLAPGTLVINVRFIKSIFKSKEDRAELQNLIRTYFDMGGMQLQINVIDQEILRDAIAHPENYQDLIIRIGGYSEYFNRLTDVLKHTVLERTEHSV